MYNLGNRNKFRMQNKRYRLNHLVNKKPKLESKEDLDKYQWIKVIQRVNVDRVSNKPNLKLT